MRIISGTHKGRRLSAPKKLPVRPTTDLAKESLFNILNNNYYFNNISIFDLFAGTGNISFEFASRGTKNIVAVDNFYGCIKYINTTASELGFSINTIKGDVFKFLDKTGLKADIIFADPPYAFDVSKFEEIATKVFLNNLLNDEGMLIIEHSKYTDLSSHKYFSFSKRYGGNVFSFFEPLKDEDL